MDPKELGGFIRNLRTEAKVGLRELSRRAEISPASLVAIEKDKTNPTLATLHKILKALGTDFTSFFSNAEQAAETPVFTAKEMRRIAGKHREYVLAFPKREGLRFEIVMETISPAKEEWEVHGFDLGGVVLSGGPAKLEIHNQGDWPLKQGDAFYIEGGLKHRVTNLGSKPLRLVTVMAPPRY